MLVCTPCTLKAKNEHHEKLRFAATTPRSGGKKNKEGVCAAYPLKCTLIHFSHVQGHHKVYMHSYQAKVTNQNHHYSILINKILLARLWSHASRIREKAHSHAYHEKSQFFAMLPHSIMSLFINKKICTSSARRANLPGLTYGFKKYDLGHVKMSEKESGRC